MLGGRQLARGHGTFLGHRLIRSRRLTLWLVGHSGGSSPNTRIQIIAANRVALIRESERWERFPDLAERFIREIVVRKIEVEFGANLSDKEDRGGE